MTEFKTYSGECVACGDFYTETYTYEPILYCRLCLNAKSIQVNKQRQMDIKLWKKQRAKILKL